MFNQRYLRSGDYVTCDLWSRIADENHMNGIKMKNTDYKPVLSPLL